jgi:hypothetical protein
MLENFHFTKYLFLLVLYLILFLNFSLIFISIIAAIFSPFIQQLSFIVISFIEFILLL